MIKCSYDEKKIKKKKKQQQKMQTHTKIKHGSIKDMDYSVDIHNYYKKKTKLKQLIIIVINEAQ